MSPTNDGKRRSSDNQDRDTDADTQNRHNSLLTAIEEHAYALLFPLRGSANVYDFEVPSSQWSIRAGPTTNQSNV